MRRIAVTGLILGVLVAGIAHGQVRDGAVDRPADNRPRAVRNDVHRPGEEIVTLRHFRIRKGSFDEFLRASVEGVWPYFEKIGARVIGMWKIHYPAGVDGVARESKDYDEVYLSTRYASLDHWKATREAVRHGGNGPDWVKCREALDVRQKLTLETRVVFLKGRMAPNGPYYMPGLEETSDRR